MVQFHVKFAKLIAVNPVGIILPLFNPVILQLAFVFHKLAGIAEAADPSAAWLYVAPPAQVIALGVALKKLPFVKVIAPVLFIIVPPVPATSNKSVPPASVIALLIVILPPVLAAIPNTPLNKVKALPLAIDTVNKSPLKILPFVVYINGVVPANDNILVAELVFRVTELVPDAICIAPIVCVGILEISMALVALNAKISVLLMVNREGVQLPAI